ncbi:hypothetical protein [Rhizorhabdus sp.]|uniref:hypothetical protein n=1 Tax=Rhizorhabdus sp. TaxID=1968843 RepID=UPI0035B1F0E3
MNAANRSAAVMAQRAPGDVEGDDALRALYRRLDYFPTPPWAARAGAELIRRLDPEARTVWEPACGEGHMAEPFRTYFPTVFASDIHPHGYGEVIDFLDHDIAADGGNLQFDWIASNPPFIAAPDFIRIAQRRTKRGVAMLLRLSFLEGSGRFDVLWGDEPLTVLAPFSERVSMVLGQWDPQAGLATAYAWFIWIKGAAPMPPQPIGPGTRARLWLPDDAARFGAKTDAPLLAAMGGA